MRDIGTHGHRAVRRSRQRADPPDVQAVSVGVDVGRNVRPIAVDGGTRFIEPPWKAILSTKGILPLLWEMAPGHPNLLEAYFEDDPNAARLGDRYARKPLHSREGEQHHARRRRGRLTALMAPMARAAFVRQALAPLPCFEGSTLSSGPGSIGDKPPASAFARTPLRSPRTRRGSFRTPSFPDPTGQPMAILPVSKPS